MANETELVPLRMLLVEDSVDDEDLLLMELRRNSFDVTHKRVETEAAMQLALAENAYDIVVCDFRMPHFTTLRALELLKASSQDIPFIIISGFVEEHAVLAILVSGAQDFISKDNWGRLAWAIKRELREAGRRRKDKLELEQGNQSTIEAWGKALELRDIETEGHTVRVTNMTVRLAGLMGITGKALTDIHRGALLHDIGKMGISDAILLKPGKLNEDERAVMSLHPELAYKLLLPIKFLRDALDIPYCHHEKWDGTGYPRGLNREAIPLAARVFAVADVYDAMISTRVYRLGLDHDYVLKYIQSESGKHFDPAVVEAFVKMMEAT